MEESRAILERLKRIEALDRTGADAGAIVRELRALLDDAVAWSSAEGGDAAVGAVEDLRLALGRDMIDV